MGLSPGSLTNQGTGSLVCVNQLTHKVSDTHGETYFVGITPTTEDSVTYSIFSNYQVGGSTESATVVNESALVS